MRALYSRGVSNCAERSRYEPSSDLLGPGNELGTIRRRSRAITTADNHRSDDPVVRSCIKLYVRNKHAEGMTSFSPDKTLLFIHGATYPAETSFDVPIDGVSMMDLFAQSGFDVYLVDVRSYGRSTRPPEMDQPPEANKPIATSEEAGADLGAAVDYILAQRGIPKLDLMGWSWGTSIAGAYTAQHDNKINRLVLYAPAWIPHLRSSRRRIRSPAIASWPRTPHTRGGSAAFLRTRRRR
jgi:pimeloyl-ACP methyl ester carboxylesterase